MSGHHPDAAELQSYADGETVDARIAEHAESCAACREEIAGIRRVTAALSLGSKPPDSLTEKVRAQRAASGRRAPVSPLRRGPMRSRNLWLPIGLAAAAVLAIFVPRAWRESPPGERPAPPGAKGALPIDVSAGETIVTETGPTSIDSISWDVSGPGITAELRYVTGLDESPRAERLAERVVERLTEAGFDRAAIVVRPVRAPARDRPLPAGAVGVTMSWRVP